MDAQKFEHIEKLYHYTKFESARKILENQTLLFGELPDMNDIYEQHKQFFYGMGADPKVNDCFYHEIGKYKQISLTEDQYKAGKRYGFDIPAMWGHYADKGQGVCLVFDKNKLLARIADGNKYYHEKVKYDKDSNNVVIGEDVQKCDEIKSFIEYNRSSIFMSKTEDWTYEQEYRILTNDDSIKSIDISGCIICALVRARKNEDFKHKQAVLNILQCKTYLYSNFGGSILLHNDEEQIFPNCRFATREEWESEKTCLKCRPLRTDNH